MRITAILLPIMFPLFLFGQNIQEDVLTLKNGEVYRGIIKETSDTSTIRLKTRAANELIFKKENIDQIKHQKVKAELYSEEEVGKQDYYIEEGYSVFTDLGFLAGNSPPRVPEIGLEAEVINTYVFSPNFSSGLGIASHLYFDDYSYLPVFINVRGSLMKGNFTPYATGGYGWNLPWLLKPTNHFRVINFKGGRFYQLGLGVKKFFQDKVAFFLEIGMTSTRLKVIKKANRPDVFKRKIIHTRNRIGFKFGFQF